LTETVAAIVAAHRTGTMTPAQTVARSYARGAWKSLCQSALQYGYDVLPSFAF